MDEEEEETCAMLWIKISHLKNGLENWKTQLRKMVEHTKELEDRDFGMKRDVQTHAWVRRRDALTECGARLRERLQDLMDEYDDFIRECDHIMAGMSLATQLVTILVHTAWNFSGFSTLTTTRNRTSTISAARMQGSTKTYPGAVWRWQKPLSGMEAS